MSALEGRVIAVAGAGGSLGPVVAKRLAAAGAGLALTDIHQANLDQLVAELDLPSERVHAQVVDLLDEDATRAWAGSIAEHFGHVDGLAHLVGGWRGGEPLATASLADYEWLHDALVRTTIHTTRAFYDALAASDHGRFVLVSSKQAQDPERHQRRLRRDQGRGRNLDPGACRLVSQSGVRSDREHHRHQRDPDRAMRAENPDKPYATFTSTDQIADAIVFLCSESGAKMNGKRLPLHPLR